VPTDKEMLQFAVEDLVELMEDLKLSRRPISGIRKLLLDRANTIDEYIETYHPDLHENTEDHTMRYLQQKIENPKMEEAMNTPPLKVNLRNKYNGADEFIDHIEEIVERIKLQQPSPAIDEKEHSTNADERSEPESLETIIQPPNPQPIQPTIPPPQSSKRITRAPKALNDFVCYSLMEATIVEESGSETVGLDQYGDPLTYRTAIAGPNGDIWSIKLSEEYDRLTKTGTITWNGYHTKPNHKKATYFSIQVKEKRLPNGEIKRRVRGTVGGDRVETMGETSSGTASMEVLKILLNAVASEDAFWTSLDIY
jgi:hypothetical protein